MLAEDAIASISDNHASLTSRRDGVVTSIDGASELDEGPGSTAAREGAGISVAKRDLSGNVDELRGIALNEAVNGSGRSGASEMSDDGLRIDHAKRISRGNSPSDPTTSFSSDGHVEGAGFNVHSPVHDVCAVQHCFSVRIASRDSTLGCISSPANRFLSSRYGRKR